MLPEVPRRDYVVTDVVNVIYVVLLRAFAFIFVEHH